MRFFFSAGLLLSLWAQNATVWHWVDTANYTDATRSYTNPLFSPAVVRVLEDTIYIAGSYQASTSTNAAYSLPTATTPILLDAFNSAGSYTRAFIAAYNRKTGEALWWVRFYRNRNVRVEDLVINPNTGALYVLLSGTPPYPLGNTYNLSYTFEWAGGGNFSGLIPVGSNGNEANYLLEIRPWQSPPLANWRFIHINRLLGAGNGRVHLEHLLWHQDTLYAVGAYEFSLSSGSWSLIEQKSGGGTNTLFDSGLLGGLLGSQSRGLLIAWAVPLSGWTLVDAAEVSYHQGPAATRAVVSYSLAYDTSAKRVRWLIGVEMGGNPLWTLTYRLSSNPSSPATSNPNVSPPSSFSSSYTLLHLISTTGSLSLPPATNLHHLAFFESMSMSIPLHLFARNDSIQWLGILPFSVALLDQSGTYIYNPSSSANQLIIARHQLLSTSDLTNLRLRQKVDEFSSSYVSPYLCSAYEERNWEFVYVGGVASGASTLNRNLPLGASDAYSSFLLGLRFVGGEYIVFGWKPLYSLRLDPPYPPYNSHLLSFAYERNKRQFYLLGTQEGSFVIERRWPDGHNDTLGPAIFPSHQALWLGRLDWYRLELSSPSNYTFLTCVPDTFPASLVALRIGTFQNNGIAPAESLYVWVPLSGPRYHPWQRAAYLRAYKRPAFSTNLLEGAMVVSLPYLYAEGTLQAGGRYVLTYPIWGKNHFTNDLWADVVDSIFLQVQGTTIPPVGRATSTNTTFMVAPYAGDFGPGPLISGPYPRYRRAGWKFNSIRQLLATPYHRQAEYLYVLDNSPLALYRINLYTGLVDSVPPPPATSATLFLDPYRGDIWAHRSALQLYRAGAEWPSQAKWDSLFRFNSSSPGTPLAQPAYPLAYDRKWVSTIYGAVVLPDGDLALMCADLPGAKRSLWRIRFSQDSAWRVIGRYTGSSNCPQDGTGNAAYIGTVSALSRLTADGDTLYWLERPSGSCALPNQEALLRKAYPTDPTDPRQYVVTTIDTLRGAFARGLVFTPLPRRALLFMDTLGSSPKAVLVRYDLETRRKDTLIQEGQLSCRYGLSDMINFGWSEGFALLRSGSIALGLTEVRLAVPIAIEGMADTLRGLSLWTGASYTGPGHVVTPTYNPGSDSLSWTYSGASGPGLDSTYIVVGHNGCTDLKPLFYPFYWLPRFGFWVSGPDTVCEGMVFHTIVGRDTEVVVENGCRVSHRLIQTPTGSAQGLLYRLYSSGNETHRWKALQAGWDTVRLALIHPKWRYLVSYGDTLEKPIRIRRGHRLRLRVALEGSYDPQTFRHRLHPFLTRYNLGAYNQRILGVTSDSLWRLPYLLGDSLIKTWNLLLIEGTCPSGGTWLCDNIGTTLARIELRTSPSGPLVDSAYAVVDAMGRLLFYRAPLNTLSAVGNADTLHFCICDTTPPKYITVRFPQHLPLHTPAVLLSSRGVGEADSLDLWDPSTLEGIPGEHYTFVPGPGGTLRAAAWAGNPADSCNAFVPGGAHVDAGFINAADYEFLLPRNGLISGGFSIGDIDCDGAVNASDVVLTIQNQNALRQSSRP